MRTLSSPGARLRREPRPRSAGVSGDVGEALLDDPVERHVDLLAQSFEPALELERAADTRVAPLPFAHQAAARPRARARPGRRAQPLHQAARHVVHSARHVDDRLRAVHDLPRRCARMVADRRGVELDRVETLAELVVQLAAGLRRSSSWASRYCCDSRRFSASASPRCARRRGAARARGSPGANAAMRTRRARSRTRAVSARARPPGTARAAARAGRSVPGDRNARPRGRRAPLPPRPPPRRGRRPGARREWRRVKTARWPSWSSIRGDERL